MRNVVQVVRPALTVLLTEDVARTAGCRLRAAASGRLGEWAGWSGPPREPSQVLHGADGMTEGGRGTGRYQGDGAGLEK